jgi:hypothetical protein
VYHVVVLTLDGTYETMSEPTALEVRSTVGPPKPTSVAVTPSSILPGQTFFVTWPRVSNPGVWTTYKVQIRNHKNFGFGLIWESAPTADIAIGYSGRLEPGIYHVVVVAMDGTYSVSSDVVPLEVRSTPPPLFNVVYPDLPNPRGEGIAYMRFNQHSEMRSYVATRYGWPSCDDRSHYGFDVWVTVSQVSATRLFFHSFTILAKENAVGFGTVNLVGGGTNLLSKQLWPDTLYQGEGLTMPVDKWADLPANLELKSGTWYGEFLSCYHIGRIDFRVMR